jgi:hypothetical protein
VGVPELVWREAPTDTRWRASPALVRAGGGARPRSAARGTGDDAEERPDWQVDPQLEPGPRFFPAPRVHADLAATSALAATDKQCATAVIEIGFGEAQGFLNS